MDVRRWSSTALDPSVRGVIRLENAGLIEQNGTLIAHGWLDIDSMGLLRVDEYQREVLHQRGRRLHQALMDGAVFPDIVLGMRGQRISFPKGSNVCELHDPVYIIDGLQRVFACKTAAEMKPELANTLKIGAEVRFDTNQEVERQLFDDLNTKRIPVSANVLLRNLRNKHPAILTLYGLCHTDKDFALYERVCWNQRMSKQEIVTATVFVKAMKTLHSLVGAMGSASAGRIASELDAVTKRMKLATFRRNVVTFFDALDEAFGIRTIEYNQTITHLRGNFLNAVGKMFGAHENFWEGDVLRIDAQMRRKLASFPINDPEIRRLAGAGNSALPLLYAMLLEHMNKGMRRNMLVKRKIDADASAN